MKSKPMKFSYSKLSAYKRCPMSYKFKYIDKIPGTQKFFFAFGSAIHSALEFMHKGEKMPTCAEVVRSFTTLWAASSYQAKGYRYEDRHAADLLKGIEMLTAYYKRYQTSKSFLVEYSTDVEVDGLAVRIIADKIELLGIKGTTALLRIVDYKTGKSVKRTPEQLMMYQLIVERDPKLLSIAQITYGKQIKKLRVVDTLFLHVPTLEEHVFERAKPKEMKSFWADALHVAGCIRKADFPTKQSEQACAWCDYKSRCPAIMKAVGWSPDL